MIQRLSVLYPENIPRTLDGTLMTRLKDRDTPSQVLSLSLSYTLTPGRDNAGEAKERKRESDTW